MTRLLTLDEVAYAFRVPNSRARTLVKDGDLLAIRVGRTTLVPAVELRRFVGSELDAAQHAIEARG